jgi:hypothetical protein
MHYRFLAVTAAGLLTAALSATAQLAPRTPAAPTPQAPPPPQPLDSKESAKRVAEAEELTKKLEEMKFGYNAKIIKELREAGTSSDKAFALWLDCSKTVDFDQRGRTLTEYSEWKRRQTKDPNRERDGELQLQVQWLTIVLMDANARTDAARAEAVAAAVLFVDNVVDRLRKSEGRMHGVAGQNVLGSVFAKHYKLDSSVRPREGGAYSPGDVDGIYDGMILPYYRDTEQPTSLMAAWKKRIAQQTAIAEAFPFREAKEKFTAEKLPELLWGQARELFMLGQEQSAAQTMYSLIQANLGHRRASEWLNEYISLLKGEDYEPKESGTTGTRSEEAPAPTPAAEPESSDEARRELPVPGERRGREGPPFGPRPGRR